MAEQVLSFTMEIADRILVIETAGGWSTKTIEPRSTRQTFTVIWPFDLACSPPGLHRFGGAAPTAAPIL